ncbi:MAG: DUF5906 domain-containing protein [Sulfuricella denitrificans]|nr:DUF5906 domain-containing protein [Sulfuricella denitrificans]
MNWRNYDDVMAQLRSAGLMIDDLVVGSSSPRRCRVEGEDHEKRGWYWLNDILLDDGKGNRESFVVGAFGVYHGNDNGKQSVKLNREKGAPALTDDQKTAIAARQKENQARMKAMRQAEINRAATEAGMVWRKYTPEGESDYLQRKGVSAHGLRFAPAGNGTVAVPMADATGKVWGLQIIRGKDRGKKLEKQYWPKGLQKQGHYHLIGGTPRGLVLIAEGYATAASLYEATQIPTVVAFDAGNLLPVTQAIKKTYPKSKILVCADDDYLTPGNPGVTAAQSAAHATTGSSYLIPKFASDRPQDKKGPTDFNDLHALEGLHTVRAQVEASIRALEWAISEPARGVAASEGGGENGDKKRRRAQSIMVLDELIERFVPLDDGTGKYVFDQWTNKVAMHDQMLRLLPAGVRGDDIKRHPEWISRGAFYLDEVGFDPAGDDKLVKLNTWQGWQLKPKRGVCEYILELLRHLCSDDPNGEATFKWLLCWMAYPLQHPGAKMASAVIMHGPQGTGKSAVFSYVLAKIYGDYATVLNQKGLEDKFNSDWSDSKLFLLAEEVVTRAEMWHIKNELKELVTGEWIRINPKNIAAYRQRNHINIIYLSNEDMPLPIDNDDRRHCVIYTPPALEEPFYDAVFQEIENGGVEAFYDYLLRLDLTDFHPKKRPPMTNAKKDLIYRSLPPQMVFINEWRSGEVYLESHEDPPLPFCPCLGSDLFAAFMRWAKKNGFMYQGNIQQFIGPISKMPGWTAGKAIPTYKTLTDRERVNRKMVIPSETDIAAAEKLGVPGVRQDPTDGKMDWLTASYHKFRLAMPGGTA